MMRCPACKGTAHKVIECEFGPNKFKRRRGCDCGHVFRTVEIVAPQHGKIVSVARVRALQAKGLTIREIAAKMGVSYQVIWLRLNQSL